MNQIALESFGAYQKARQLFKLVVTDMEVLKPIRYVISARVSASRQRRFDLCKHRRGLWKGEPNRVSAFSISHGALPVKREGDTNGLDTSLRLK
jgi:hypothetical protein